MAGVLIVALLTPVPSLVADTVSRWRGADAVQQILDQDLGLKINATDPELSNSTAAYQSRYTDELQEIQDASAAYSEQSKKWQTELAAYSLLSNYQAAGRGLQLAEEQLEQALNQYHSLLLKQEQGLASEMEVKQARMSYNQAASTLEDAEQQHTSVRLQLNQKLGNDFDKELVIALPDVTVLSESTYRAARTFEQIKDDHAALSVPRKTVEVYKDIFDKVDRATVMGGRQLEDQIEALDEQRVMLEQLYSGMPDSDPDKAETLEKLRQIIGQQSALEEQLDDAEDDRHLAVKELEPYYKEKLEESELQLQMQLDALELMCYQYEERLDGAAAKLGLLRDNARLADELYQSAERRFEQGLSTFAEVDSARISLLNSQMQLYNHEAQYQTLQIEYGMFKEGYMPSGM